MTTGADDDAEIIRVRAPGVVGLLGRQTPGVGGPVLSVAIDRYVEIAGIRDGDVVELRSDRFPGVLRVGLDIADDAAGSVRPDWGRVVAGAVAVGHPDRGVVGSITSTLSAGVGLGSSSALAVAGALVLGADPGDAAALARLVERAEQLAGVGAGVADPLAIITGRRDHAVLVDTDTSDVLPVPLPTDVEIVVVNTGQDRGLAASTSLERAAECAAAAADIGPLDEASAADVERLTDPLLRRRARHVASEHRRVRAAVEALAAGDLEALGRLLVESHASARDEFEVSTPTADNIVSRLARTPGVYGARLTGAGFGGCIVALVRPGTRLASGLDATVLRAVDGAAVVR
ncbi:MAG: galactokinase [Ilumatobacteraceae bacterium]